MRGKRNRRFGLASLEDWDALKMLKPYKLVEKK
jgi:hypothetical protein